jgi:dUTP pyrophosphatase
MLRPAAADAFPGAPASELQLQPAGFDLTVATVCQFVGQGSMDLTNERRTLPQTAELPWVGSEPLLLKPGAYLITYSEEISVPLDCAGLVVPRSSLLRCGATIHSALWEPGYHGRGQGLLVVFHQLVLHPAARIAQYIQLSLEQAAATGYGGTYQGENLGEAACG